ncbi:hypothetical protein LWI29_008272 [Acer saccharum]|uniref:Uncharacterized protein n=1 Tax=Acer saccharum TaxID=4024 RepID=A0AA39SLG4_ACESA|nr:hypothetical protein LWI29_008272 [Acer saccharum]
MATPEPAYGVPTVSVVGEGFCVPYPVELIVKRKTKGLSDTRFEVLDVNGNLFLQVDGTSLAFQCKRVMHNPADTHSQSSLDSSSGRKLKTTQSPLQRARIACSPTTNPA